MVFFTVLPPARVGPANVKLKIDKDFCSDFRLSVACRVVCLCVGGGMRA